MGSAMCVANDTVQQTDRQHAVGKCTLSVLALLFLPGD